MSQMNIDQTLQQIIEKELSRDRYDVQVESNSSGLDTEEQSWTYLVKVKSRPRVAAAPASEENLAKEPKEEKIYSPDGKLNLTFLQKNAEVLFRYGDFAHARKIFETMLKSGERSGTCHFWLGRCHEEEGRISEAKRHYEDSIAFQPAIESYRRLSALLVKDGKDQEAAELIERALTMRNLERGLRAELHQIAGNCWNRIKKYPHAERNYTRALEVGAQNLDQRTRVDLHSQLGQLHAAQERDQDAVRCFQEVLAIQPRHAEAYFGLAQCHLRLNDRRAAHDALVKSLDCNLNQPNALFHLVKLAYELKTYASAARIVADYVQVAPVNANLLYSLGGLQFHLGRIDEAKGTINQILSLQPEHSGARDLMDVISRMGR